MKKLIVGTEVIPYSITYSLKAKRKRIVIKPSGVKVVLPQGSKEEKAIELIESKKRRVSIARKRLLQQEKRFKSQTDVEYVSEAKIPFLGRTIQLLVYPEKRMHSLLFEDNCRLIVKVQTDLTAKETEKEVKVKVEGWIKEQVLKEAFEAVTVFEKKIGILPKGIRIKGQKKVWGSCGRNHVINLNWRLCLFPKKVFEYVVAHEMCHLRHMNHSREFWGLVFSIMPEYKKYRDWLKFRGYGSL